MAGSKSDKENKLKEYIDFLGATLKKDERGNITPREDLDKDAFRINYQKVSYAYFMTSGDYHYFIARIIFVKGAGIYAFFSGHQCIENYLQAFIKYLGIEYSPKGNHNLLNYLSLAKERAPKRSFLRSNQIKTICDRFNPFYELPRYPVHHARPKDGLFGFLMPDDIYLLDYFVLKMREIMPLPKGTWDVLDKGIPYEASMIENISPELIEAFKNENVNFENQ